MVYVDIGTPVELNKIGQIKSTAHLMDRFFSFVIDYLVISPFVLFTLYLSFNNGFKYWKSNPLAAENDTFIILSAICFVLYFSLIQTLFVLLWRATPGQYFLKIKMDFGEDASMIFLKAFFRQICFWVSFLLLGLPFLSVMTNKRRRTFYDQISDVTIVSLKNEKVFFDFELEFRYWRALLATLTMFTAFLFVSLLWGNYEKIVNRAFSFVEFEKRQFFCDEMSEVAGTQRLQVAIALNLVNQLSDKCLDKEADFVLWRQKYNDYSLAYYAKSLTAQESFKEKNYLNQACFGQNSEDTESLNLGCRIARAFKTNNFENLYSQLKDDNFLEVTLKYELSRIFNKDSDVAANFDKLDAFNDFKPVKKYQVIELLRAQSGEAYDNVAEPEVSEVAQDNDAKDELPNSLWAAEETALQKQFQGQVASDVSALRKRAPAAAAMDTESKATGEELEQRKKIIDLIEGL